MRYLYLDASALAKRYFPETGAEIVDLIFLRHSPDRVFVLNLGVAEVVSILVRKRNAQVIAYPTFVQALANFRAEVINQARLVKIAPDTNLVMSSLPLINLHAINATDATLLRSALDLAEVLRAQGDDLLLVASDLRLLRAAEAEGLAVFNPETQTVEDFDRLLS